MDDGDTEKGSMAPAVAFPRDSRYYVAVRTIRGKLFIYALGILSAAILLVSAPRSGGPVEGVVVALALAMAALAVWTGHSIARGVAGLVAATRRITEEQYDVPLPVGRPDEIGLLARQIDQMRGLLREKVRELEELAHGLERKVERRTEELRKANERLSLI